MCLTTIPTEVVQRKSERTGRLLADEDPLILPCGRFVNGGITGVTVLYLCTFS